jgi:sugar phosphate isomerase/epimerase
MTNHSEGLTRRRFLTLAGAVPVAWAIAPQRRVRALPRIPVALQMYSVRGDSAMGFEGVEFAGYYNYAQNAAGLAARLKALGLKAAGTHIRTSALEGDALKATIEFHQAIGCRFLIVPGDPAFTDPEKSKALAGTYNKAAAVLKPLGMACGFHNHTGEFKKDGDKTYWDLFAERTTKDVILQQDCGWTMAAGFDPVEYIRKYPGRTRTTHFKPTVREGDAGKKAIFGQDSVDWRSVYEACATVGGTEWIVLEQETYPDGKAPMDCTRESYAGVKALIAAAS